MKRLFSVSVVLLFIICGCTENTKSLEYGGVSIQYSDESIHVEYDDKSYDIVDRDVQTESESTVLSYDPEKVIDLFTDMEE